MANSKYQESKKKPPFPFLISRKTCKICFNHRGQQVTSVLGKSKDFHVISSLGLKKSPLLGGLVLLLALTDHVACGPSGLGLINSPLLAAH